MPGSPSQMSFTPGPGSASPSATRGGSRMRESRTYGSVRGALSNERPYRDRGHGLSRRRSLSYAVPTSGIDTDRGALGGHGARWPLQCGTAVPCAFAHPTKQDVSPRQERHRQLVKQIGRIPRHQVLAAIGEMQIELRIALMQKRGALL